jgi:hypothetical protein
MTDKDYQDAKKSCYSLAHSLGNNAGEQHALISALRDAETEETGYNNIIRRMLAVFYDGLAYGNWPWMKSGINILTSEKVSK